MTSKQVKDFVKEGETGKLKLYKLCEKHFALVDQWESALVEGDLLSENELAQCMERLTGVMMRLGPIAGTLESHKEFVLQNALVREQAKFEKMRVQDGDVAKAIARKEAEEIGGMVSDFRHYYYAASSGVVMAQSRIKRLSTIKGASHVDNTGEVK